MDQASLQLASREINLLMTPGYRPPPSYVTGMPWLPGLPRFTMDVVDAMRRDYQVKLAMAMKVVPVMKPLFAITGDPDVVDFVKSELRSIWTSSITDITEGMWYTRFGCEMVYKRADDDVIRFARMAPYHPRDFRILTKDGEIVGLRVTSSANTADPDGMDITSNLPSPSGDRSRAIIFAPKCFVYVHDKKFGGFEGMSELEGAYPPWLEKVREGGANASRSLWAYKCVFDSGMLIYPDGYYTDPVTLQQIPNRDFAMKVLEAMRNGSTVAIPGTVDINGNPLWHLERPVINEGGSALLELIDHYDGKINKGSGIPDDVIEQVSGTGSYAGRTIPFIAFLEAGTPTVRNISRELCRQCLVPLAQINFGESRGKDWEITEAGVNTKEFLGDSGAGANRAQVPGDGDGDGIPNEDQNKLPVQMSLARIKQAADALGLEGNDRTRFTQGALASVYAESSVTFQNAPPRKVLRSKVIQMSVADQPRDELGRWTSGHPAFKGKLPRDREKLHPIDASQAVNSMGFHVGLQHKDPDTGRMVYKVLNSRGEVKHLNVDELRNLAYSTPAADDSVSADDIIDAMHKLEPGAWRGALVGARDLRKAIGDKLTKDAFDAKILEMSKSGDIVLHRHDYASSLSQGERDELVSYPADDDERMAYRGRIYVIGMAMRPRQMSLGDEVVNMGQGRFAWDEEKHPRDHGKFSSKPGASGIANEPFSLKREKSSQFSPKNAASQAQDLFGENKLTHSPTDDAVKPQVESLPGQKIFDDDGDIYGPHHVTKTPAFKAWFGDWESDPENASKVVDSTGQPKKTGGTGIKEVFHGTMADFEVFDKTLNGKNASMVGEGFYFSENKAIADSFAKAYTVQNGRPVPRRGKVISAYLAIRKPFNFDQAASKDDVGQWANAANELYGDKFQRADFLEKCNKSLQYSEKSGKPITNYDLWRHAADSCWQGTKDVNKIPQQLGYDGLTHQSRDERGAPWWQGSTEPPHGRVWIAFEPTQIKATSNSGTFDPSNPNIQMSQSTEPSGRWITIGGHEGPPDGKRHGGVAVLIGRNGKILKGPAGLKGDNIKSLGDSESRDARQARQAHAKAMGKSGRDLSDQEARQLGSKAHIEAHSHAKQFARQAGVSTHDVLQNMPEAHKYRLEQHGAREAAKTRARTLTGLNAGNLAKFENTYKDYSKVPGFDTAARTIAMEHPELGLDPDDDATAPAVWELIREGKVAEPRLHDPETAQQAAEWVAQAKLHHKVPTDHDDAEDTSFDFGFGGNELGEGENPFHDFSLTSEQRAQAVKSEPRDSEGRWTTGANAHLGKHYVVRRTKNPESDLARGWSAWNGQFEESPLSLAEVDNAMASRNLDEGDLLNDLDDEHTIETDDGWEIANTPAAKEAVAEWIRDNLDLDVQRDPTTGLYGLRHHDGLSSYHVAATDHDDAAKKAATMNENWRTGGVRGIGPVAYKHIKDDIYLFHVQDLGAQAES